MKKYVFCALALSALLVSCGNGDNQYDASGVFEATEVIVSAQGNGEIMKFDITEGQTVEADAPVGYIDTVQLHLKKKQLMASMKAVGSRHYDVSRQVASIEQQIATQRREAQRFERLVKANAANQKQVDDINSQIAVLKKQLEARREDLQNNNNSIGGESLGLEAQVSQIDDQMLKCIIKSPVGGTVLAKYAEMGELATQGRALFKVADLGHIFLRAYITAGQLTELKIGQQVTVFADQGDKDRKEYKGTVTWIAGKAEFTPKTIQTRDERANLVYAVKIAVTNDGLIKRGMYGDVKFSR